LYDSYPPGAEKDWITVCRLLARMRAVLSVPKLPSEQNSARLLMTLKLWQHAQVWMQPYAGLFIMYLVFIQQLL